MNFEQIKKDIPARLIEKTVKIRDRFFRSRYALLIAENAVVRTRGMRDKNRHGSVFHGLTPISSSAARAASCSADFLDLPLPDDM